MLERMSLTGKSSKSLSGISKLVLPYREFRCNELIDIACGTSSKGNQRKWKTLDGKYYVKGCFEYQRLWYDNLVEVCASQYAGLCTLPREVTVVAQGLCTIDGIEGSYSTAFDLNGTEFVSFLRILHTMFNLENLPTGDHEQTFSNICDYVHEVVGDVGVDYILAMTVLDLIVLNEDRHLNNFGFVHNGQSIGTAPLFDFGLGLCEHDLVYSGKSLDYVQENTRLKPCWFKPDELIEFLLDNHSQFVNAMLPKRIRLGDFQFPSTLARDWFSYVNERLGVIVG